MFAPDKDIPDLSGKVFFITGGNTGLGKETILQLAKHNPAHIYMGARSASKAAEAIASIREAVPDAPVTHIPLDLTSFESIKAAAADFNSRSPRLDALINNAGIMGTAPGQTREGYEIQFGTNHMGHALLTKLLLPALRSTSARTGGDARVVNVSSHAHNMALGGIATDKARMDAGNRWGRYGNSKLANILHARALAAHEPAVKAVSLHPGLIRTQLYDAGTGGNVFSRASIALGSRLFFTDVPRGSHNQLWAATAPIADLDDGAFYATPGSSGGLMMSGNAKNDAQRDQLWDFTEKELAAKGA